MTMARNTSLRSSSSSGSKAESSLPFFHAPAPALPFSFNSSDEEDGDGGGEEEERAAAAWAARCCEPEAPNAVDAEVEAEWLARTATATTPTTATAAPTAAGAAAEAAEGGRTKDRVTKKRRILAAHAGEGRGQTPAEANEITGNAREKGEQGGDEEGGDEDEDAGMLYIHNVMAYARLNCPVNLDAACQTFGNAVYMPGVFESVRVDLRCRTRCIASINIFSNGKLTGTGANSVEELRHAMKKVGRRLLLHPLTRCPVVFSHFRVRNILGSFSFSSPLSLHALAAERGLAADYEPERFPAVKVRVPVPADVHKQQQAVGQASEQRRGTGEENEKDGKGGGGTGGQNTTGGGGAGQEMWSTQKQQQDGKEQQLLHAAWDSSGGSSSTSATTSDKEMVVTLHLFSTGNVTLFGGRSVESLQYALQCVLPFLHRCRAHTD